MASFYTTNTTTVGIVSILCQMMENCSPRQREKCLGIALHPLDPSSIYSWSIGHILEHEFWCLGRLGSQGSKDKKVDLRNSEQLFRVFFSTFGGQKKKFKFF